MYCSALCARFYVYKAAQNGIPANISVQNVACKGGADSSLFLYGYVIFFGLAVSYMRDISHVDRWYLAWGNRIFVEYARRSLRMPLNMGAAPS